MQMPTGSLLNGISLIGRTHESDDFRHVHSEPKSCTIPKFLSIHPDNFVAQEHRSTGITSVHRCIGLNHEYLIPTANYWVGNRAHRANNATR